MSTRTRTSLPRPIVASAPPAVTMETPVVIMPERASWYGGMTTTTKLVLAVIIGIAIVFLLAWLMCPAYRRDCDDDRLGHHGRRHRDSSWCFSGSSDDCDDDVRLVVISPAPASAPAPAPATAHHPRGYRYRDDCGWSGSSEDCDRDRRRRHC